MVNIINVLKQEFPQCNFKFLEDEYSLNLLYSNEEFIDDEDFFDKVFNIVSKQLPEEKMFKLAIIYDYLKQL